MAIHAMYDDLNKIKNNFIRCGNPFYAVCDHTGTIMWVNDSEADLNSAAEMLEQDLKNIRQGNTAIYTVKHFKKVPNGGFKKGQESDNISTFKQRVLDEAGNYAPGVGYGNYAISKELADLRLEIQNLKTALVDGDDPDDEDLKKESEPVGFINGVLANPNFQQVITNVLSNIAGNLMTPGVKVALPVSLAGTGTDGPKTISIQEILDALFAKGVTLNDLYLLSQKTQDEMNFLLSMLRK